jgi:hypothetical protein
VAERTTAPLAGLHDVMADRVAGGLVPGLVTAASMPVNTDSWAGADAVLRAAEALLERRGVPRPAAHDLGLGL